MSAGLDTPPADLRPYAQALADVGRLAPSLHNAQPWSFRVGADHVDVLLTTGRGCCRWPTRPAGRRTWVSAPRCSCSG